MSADRQKLCGRLIKAFAFAVSHSRSAFCFGCFISPLRFFILFSLLSTVCSSADASNGTENRSILYYTCAQMVTLLWEIMTFPLEACESPEVRWVWVRVSSCWDTSPLRSLGQFEHVNLSDTMNWLQEKEPK